MDGKEFWDKVDMLLSDRKKTLVSLSKETGIAQSTIYRQRERNQLPKMKDFRAIESFFGVRIDNQEKDDCFSNHEWKVIMAYRSHPEFQIAIDSMLGLKTD